METQQKKIWMWNFFVDTKLNKDSPEMQQKFMYKNWFYICIYINQVYSVLIILKLCLVTLWVWGRVELSLSLKMIIYI